MQTLEQLKRRVVDGHFAFRVSDDNDGLRRRLRIDDFNNLRGRQDKDDAREKFISDRRAEIDQLQDMRRELVEDYPHDTDRLAAVDSMIAANVRDADCAETPSGS